MFKVDNYKMILCIASCQHQYLCKYKEIELAVTYLTDSHVNSHVNTEKYDDLPAKLVSKFYFLSKQLDWKKINICLNL